MHMPGCVGCVSALHVPAATRLQQHTPKTKNKQKYTVMNALHGIHGTQRKHPLERHTHTHTHRHGGSKARTPAAETMRPLHQHARTHARMHMQHTATGPGCEGKEKRGKGVTRRKRKKKKGRGQGVQLVRLHWIGTISGRAPPPAALPCTAPASNGGSGQRAARERSDEEKSPGVPDCTGRGEGWEGTQRVRVAAEMNLWEMLCCCQVAACAVAWVPAMHHHLVWRTQWHTPASVIIIISCGCLSGRLSLLLLLLLGCVLMTQRWRSVGEERRRRRKKWNGRGSHQQRQWMQSEPHGITAALPCPMHVPVHRSSTAAAARLLA